MRAGRRGGDCGGQWPVGGWALGTVGFAVGGPVGAVVGGIVGGALGAGLGSKAKHWAFDQNPGGVFE